MATTQQQRRPRGFTRLMGLPGVKRRCVRAVSVGSITEAMRFIRQRAAVSTAGSDGAINVWLDDAGEWRAEFQRYMVTRSRVNPKSRGEMLAWLKEWWPKLGR